MSHTTLSDDGNNRDHDLDADLGGLDEEIRRHRAIATDVTRGPAERDTAQTTAKTIAHCVYLLRGKTLIGVGIGVLIWVRRFRRTATVIAATASMSSAAAISGAAVLAPSTSHDVAKPPPASTAPTHHQPTHQPVRHHRPPAPVPAGGNDIDQHDPARPAPRTTATIRQVERPPSHRPARPTAETTTVGVPPPTVVQNDETTRPSPTTAPTRPDQTPTPTPESTPAPSANPPVHLRLPVPVKITVSGLLGLN